MQTMRWSQVSMIFQGAMNAFNPVYRVGDQIEEALEAHMEMTAEQREARIQELFKLVGMTADRSEGYPHEFSGGMKQRAMIAMALACKPDLIIADEPTTALDVIMQDRILGEIRDLQRELDLAMMIITHDISVVAEVSDRIVIMYAGEIVEEGTTESVFERPSHPYALGLLEAFPSVKGPKKKLRAIPGSPPDLVNPPTGCRFHPRCRFAQDICTRERPELIEVDTGHRSRCTSRRKYSRGALHDGGWRRLGRAWAPEALPAEGRILGRAPREGETSPRRRRDRFLDRAERNPRDRRRVGLWEDDDRPHPGEVGRG